jgi:hypothetical protein
MHCIGFSVAQTTPATAMNNDRVASLIWQIIASSFFLSLKRCLIILWIFGPWNKKPDTADRDNYSAHTLQMTWFINISCPWKQNLLLQRTAAGCISKFQQIQTHTAVLLFIWHVGKLRFICWNVAKASVFSEFHFIGPSAYITIRSRVLRDKPAVAHLF